ncbi:hypothetical protein BG015_007583 [Linnemannia schmuckeri]|uniref:F-box domain-containing protein n=1 Tax=Linnemannia schmuckeri TaxID=64567 RepID=A0A9P5S692_9FUNG|nr:hypothetical protein BG015_007583 [Linnemannia schmuckeri]
MPPFVSSTSFSIITDKESASARFFQIPDLVLFVIRSLDPRDVSSVTKTSRLLYIIGEPYLFRKVSLLGEVLKPSPDNIPKPARSLEGVARNAASITTIILDDDRLLHRYYNSLRDVVCAKGLLPPGPTTRMPPVPSLESEDQPQQQHQQSLDSSSSQIRWSLEDLCSKAVTPARVRYCLQASPLLTTLRIDNIMMPGRIYAVYWAATISGLKMLGTLSMDFVIPDTSRPDDLFSTIVHGTPPSLKSLSLGVHGHVGTQRFFFHENPHDDPTYRLLLNAQTSETSIIRDENSLLPNLTEWNVYSPYPWDYQTFRNILRRLPNLVSMEAPNIRLNIPVHSLAYARFIVNTCPGLRRLSFNARESCKEPESLLAIMAAMHEKSLESLDLHDYDFTHNNLALALTRHYTSLRRLEFQGVRIGAGTLRLILVNCSQLEVLKALEIPVRLERLTQERWVSTRIQELHITIDAGETHIPIQLNNRRHFSLQHKEKVEQLESLYRQLSVLTELKVLDLRLYTCTVDRHFNIDLGLSPLNYVLSGLLTVSDESKDGGMWGGLQLLSGLKSLTVLKGLFAFNVATLPGFIMGEKDVKWVAENWPKLERIEFFTGAHATNSPKVLSSIAWLRTKLPHVEFVPFNY